jgi:hypothetical protein
MTRPRCIDLGAFQRQCAWSIVHHSLMFLRQGIVHIGVLLGRAKGLDGSVDGAKLIIRQVVERAHNVYTSPEMWSDLH